MKQPFSQQLCDIADSMGLALYQRMSLYEAALFLRSPQEAVQSLIQSHKIGYVTLPSGEVEFFGYMLLQYILDNISEPQERRPSRLNEQNRERILSLKEVTQLVGFSRTTLWRMERAGKFPSRIPLSDRRVGWRFDEVDTWLRNK